MSRQAHRNALSVAHTTSMQLLEQMLGPDVKVAMVMIAEIDGDGIHIGFDIEDVPPRSLVRLLRDAAARLEELQG